MRHPPSLNPLWMLCLVVAAMHTSACVGEVPPGDDVDGGATAPSDAGTDPTAPDAGTPSCSNITGERATQVCLRWKCDRADLSEGTWSGAVSGCNAGDLGTSARANSLRLINLYRFLAELPPVTTDAVRNQKAQECALMMDANNSLNHSPPTTVQPVNCP